MNAVIPAEVFPPGEFLKEELEARNWTQIEFAEIIGKDTRLVYEIIGGKRAITPETAMLLSEALGTSPELWMNLESQYQLSKVRAPRDAVARRAKLHGLFPVRDMAKRGWIESTDSIDALEKQIKDFFRLSATEEIPVFCHAAKKTNYEATSMQQLAWLFRAQKIASTMVVPTYSEKKLRESLSSLSALLSAPEEARHVPRILSECGVRFVVVESLPGAKIDGACFWLDKNSPVIAMTLIRDRIDNFWFVLRHEIEHILEKHRKDGFIIDENVGGEVSPNTAESEEEKAANAAGANFCVPNDKFTGFVARVNPLFSEERVVAFAKTLGIHPGLVVGQIQHLLGKYYLFKKYQVKIRQSVISAAVYDGWGQSYPID